MKEFNIVTKFDVSLFNRRPLAVGMIYGKVDGVTYVFQPVTKELSTHVGAWAKPCTNQAVIDKIWSVLNRKREKWPVSIVRFDGGAKYARTVKERMMHTAEQASRPHVVDGAPVRREVQKNYTRFVGSCYSQRAIEGKGYTTCEYEERVRDVVVYDEFGHVEKVVNSRGDGYRPYERPYDHRKPMEVGQHTAGPEQFLPQRNSLPALDRTHGKPEKREVKAVAMPSHKRADRVRSTSELIAEVKEVEAEHASRVASVASTRPNGHAFTSGKPGGNAVRKVIHGEQV